MHPSKCLSLCGTVCLRVCLNLQNIPNGRKIMTARSFCILPFILERADVEPWRTFVQERVGGEPGRLSAGAGSAHGLRLREKTLVCAHVADSSGHDSQPTPFLVLFKKSSVSCRFASRNPFLSQNTPAMKNLFLRLSVSNTYIIRHS